jgi:transposase-like protein
MNETTEILKVDEAGRVRTPREKQEALLDAYEGSGMTGMQFARHVGVKYPTLMNWVQRRRREQGSVGRSSSNGSRWIEAVVEDGGAGGVVAEVPGGLVLRINGRADASVAAELLRSLGYGRPC